MNTKIKFGKDPIAKLKTDAQSAFISPFELELRLKELEPYLGIESLGFQIQIVDTVHQWGKCIGAPAITHEMDGIKLSLYVSAPSRAADLTVQQHLHQLISALAEVWGKEYRKHGGLNFQASGAVAMLQNSLLEISNLHDVTNLSVVYIDLDEFKKINDQGNHSEGDRAIRTVYAEMHNLCREFGGLALIAGGDEFLLILPCKQKMDVSSRLWRLRNRIREFRFGSEKNYQVNLTAGIVTKSWDEISKNIQNIFSECEELTKLVTNVKEKRRGTINFERTEPRKGSHHTTSIENLLKLGICISKSKHHITNCFGDERLNLISHEISSLSSEPPSQEQIHTSVQDVLDWFGAKVTKGYDELSLVERDDTASEISQAAVAIAIVHALAKAAIEHDWEGMKPDTLSIAWCKDSGDCQVQFNGHGIWGALEGSNRDVLHYGDLNNSNDRVEGVAVGVQIGFEESPQTPGGMPLPDEFLIDYVRVDVRPITGGGLPDFWQAAFAQIVSALDRSEIASKIIVWGEKAEETEIYNKITKKGSWSNDEIASLTGLSSQRVADITKEIDKNIITVKNSEQLLDNLYHAYQNFSRSESKPLKDRVSPPPSLQRPMINATPLEQSEGIVCTTAKIAYPLIIDTLRKTQNIRLAIDDSGQEQRELIAFKLKLTNPTLDKIPHYLHNQQEELEKYADTVLLSSDGLIRKQLEKNDQVDSYCKYLAKYLNQPSPQKSTRRACLVVPHKPDDKGPRPFGLISVWSTPRFTDNTIFLDFVFVWRTVEAFIGLPYSLYGSIRLSEQLTEKVINASGMPSENIKIGEINYIALSLHIGSDEFHTRVAKQIVDMASD
ncbi:hypothetical protein IPC1122_09160 [Pseudomonas aeruginosa]|uniref:diguanylate cyclase n=1 Tax=Pseudomonas aeruginosa TaxID=287 RepID=UPI00053D4FC1|nr:diguanylate cyclase [Pseudomonas aeruginosa]MDI3611679.1 diguanylate cyclase [Pseudomonas aeruginosa]MDI4012098.1 diguanylate cyclase [Pseudomonas aeruginosa]MDI4025030.1 diguanylate cyclase [Pseudomonas aeruginosa]RPQ23666.1 hypothetical protein IPC1122_09160 [Pseudomonas aeruginosa]HBO3498545.1 diguanylate cyclase [Pseudomonas aeruginosa]